MATEEKSRDAFEPTKRYAAVGMQLGRVLVDDDFNEAERIHLEEERRVNLDVIGPVGSPDDGFLVGNGQLTGGRIDFEIGAGTLYLGGLRLWNPATVKYSVQTDWLQQAVADRPALAAGTTDLVYVEAWQQPVTAIEDGELFEVALGGPDTSTRLRTMWRVHIAPRLQVDDCPAAWSQVTAGWQAAGLGTLDPTGERVVDAKLTVSYLGGVAGDLCTPAIASGYLGAENQTIRVQLVDATHLTWGYDNGAPLYRASVAPGGLKVILASEPRDQAHWPVAGQIIEVLPWSTVLPNGEKLAEEVGHLARVTSYNPTTREVGIAAANVIPAGFGTAWQGRPDQLTLGTAYYFVRVWDRGDDHGSDPAILFAPGSPVTLGSTGLRVTLGGTARVAGDHWIIAARPKTPDQVVPWELESGRRAHGTRRWFAPLALIEWQTNGSFKLLHDCRPHFLPLTRLRGCCTYTVGDEIHSFGKFKSIQAAIDALPADGGKVCVLPGIYQESVILIGRKHVTIEGCGRRSIVRPGANLPFGFFAIGGGDLTIRSLAIEAPVGFGVIIVDGLKSLTGDPTVGGAKFVGNDAHRFDGLLLEELTITVADYGAIALLGARNVTIRRCDIVAGPMDKPLAFDDRGRWPAILSFADHVLIEENRVAAPKESVQLLGATTAAGVPTYTRTALGGIQIGGGSEHIELRRNRIVGGNGDGITLGSWAWVKVADSGLDWAKLVELWIWIGTFGTLTVNDDGCVEQDPDPKQPDDHDDYVPVSMGDVYDVRIIDNTIEAMGKSGLGVARFFDLSGHDEIIGVHGLEVLGNRIHGCLQLGIPSLPAKLREVTGFGAIALAEISDAVFRDNDIARNGRRHTDPVCGLFALRSSGVRVERNRILDNAPWVETEEPTRPGWRGGIVLYRALPPTKVLDIGLKLPFLRQNGEPTARIADNVIVVPNGRAILVLGVGQVTIHDNHLTVRGVGRADISALFGGRFSTDVGGNAKALDGWTTADLLDFLGGIAVLVIDLGFSNELFGLQLIAYLAAKDIELGVPGLDPLPPIAANGQISFNDNQVGVDLLGPPLNAVLSAVALISLDDVAVADNQIEIDRAFDLVLATLVVIGISTRITGNRIKEAMLPGTQAAVLAQLIGVSALTVGIVMNNTSNNQTTRCLTVAGISKIDTPNQILLAIFNPDVCGDAKLAEGIATGTLPMTIHQ